jgi:predicted  nucleic acid-binding Zn-ribbon protein
MTRNCKEWYENLTSTAEAILNDDLTGLARNMSEQMRIERYNEIKADENELRFDFNQECPNFRTNSELDRDRSRLRLARLWIVASFYKEGDVPTALANEFSDAAIEAAVDFDRYKQFDVLSEEQISKRIRRMEGEVYELVTEYTDSQLSNLDEVTDNPKVQQDVIRQLNEEYDERLAKVRQGFYTYVEEHRGLGGMISAVEDAIESVSEAQATREATTAELQEQIEELSTEIEQGFRQQRSTVERQIRSVEQQVAHSNPELEEIKTQLESIDVDGARREYRETIDELENAIADTQNLESRLERQIEELKEAKRESEDAEDAIAENVTNIVDEELQDLERQRDQIRSEIQRLRQERESIESASDQLVERQEDITERVQEIEQSVETDSGGIDGESVVTPVVARLMELDYIGRFETNVRNIQTIYMGNRTRDIPDGYWEDRSVRRNQRPKLADLVDEKSANQFPVNRSAQYEITSSQYLGLTHEAEMILEAAVVSDLEAHATNGFDATPADLEDLLSYVNRTVYEAEREDVMYLLGLASPTGWTDAVEQKIANDGVSRTRFSRHVSVVLVDLQDGSIVYDESDSVADRNSSLFTLPVDEEKIQACVDDIQDRFERPGFGTEGVILDNLVAEEGYDHHIVKRAFDYYTDERGYEQRFVDDQLVLFGE